MTRRALVTGLVGVALLLIATTIRSGWLYLVASVLFALVVTGLVSGWLATRSVEIGRDAPARVFERERFDVTARLSNRGRAGRRLVSVTDLQFPGAGEPGLAERVRRRRSEFREFLRTGKAPAGVPRAPGEGGCALVIEHLPAGSSVDVPYHLEAPGRGVYPPAEMRVSSGGVFGNARFTRRTRVGEPLVVFPGIYPLDSFRFDPRARASKVEPVEWSRKGIGQDYYGTREYVRGDSLRHIHWPSSARQRRLIVKEYEQELKPSVVLAPVLFRPRFGGDYDNSLEDGMRASSSVISLQESMGGLPLMVLPSGDGFTAVERFTLYDCLEELARYEPLPHGSRPEEAIAAAHAKALEAMRPGSAIVTITNGPPGDVAAALEAGTAPGGTLVLVLDDSYAPGWDDEWLDEAPWLAGFTGLDLEVYAVTPSRGITRCLSEPLNTTA